MQATQHTHHRLRHSIKICVELESWLYMEFYYNWYQPNYIINIDCGIRASQVFQIIFHNHHLLQQSMQHVWNARIFSCLCVSLWMILLKFICNFHKIPAFQTCRNDWKKYKGQRIEKRGAEDAAWPHGKRNHLMILLWELEYKGSKRVLQPLAPGLLHIE